jgi:hypothetical protein
MSDQIFVLKDGEYPRDAANITEKTSTHAIGYPIGGGFSLKIPLADFEAKFRPFDPEKDVASWKEMRFDLDDYFGDEGLKGYSKGGRWNGWEIPVFEKPEADHIAEVMQDIKYDAENDQFVFPTGHDDEPYIYCKGFDIDVSGEIKHVYPMGDSWTWSKTPE